MNPKLKIGKTFNDILLIPTDFSPKCDNAVQQGIQMAEKLKYKVMILHVIDRQNETILNNRESGQECIGINFQRYKEEFGRDSRLEIETMVRKSGIVSGILSVAAEIKAGMLIFGTNGKQGLEYLFGSNALKLVLNSPCPVVVVQKRSFYEGYKNIVLPVNNDTDPRQAVSWILTMCRIYNSRIHLFLSSETDISLKNRVKIIAGQISGLLRESNLEYKLETAGSSRDFVQQVIAYASDSGSDLIIIMTRPELNPMGFSLTGWNEKIMFNQDQIAVMCINPIKVGEQVIDWMG
jgi:nucleotide-binding universal stress UspA family protein